MPPTSEDMAFFTLLIIAAVQRAELRGKLKAKTERRSGRDAVQEASAPELV